jgi:hypothetical protein
MSRYKELFDEMLAKNRELFIKFKIVHDLYASNPKENYQEFNELGEQILPIIREYENILCGHSEQGQFSKYSANLADKFWTEVRKNYPRIDFVGIKQTFR